MYEINMFCIVMLSKVRSEFKTVQTYFEMQIFLSEFIMQMLFAYGGCYSNYTIKLDIILPEWERSGVVLIIAFCFAVLIVLQIKNILSCFFV
jgi:hypothetical protein